MKKTPMIAAALVLAGASTAVHAGTTSASEGLTLPEVSEFKRAWGEGIVNIGEIHTSGGDYRQAAEDHILHFYAYGERPVLFKPTLASEDQFRGTFDEALSYFVGGDLAEDGGFAIAPYTNVRWESEGTVISGDTAMSMGNYYFMQTDGNEVKVEYTFGIEKLDSGEIKFVLHHSSLPFTPG
ncbi:phosphoribosyl-AMP cyclohydrolase [Tateyamaria armeniaca]|uniref:Phosphoribosyl-AMP cyclohydrolase n=1 Tax=Tateyamaria armeniaca TaxID=2518930 RepID=A0ABW8UU50_9RHOB